MVVLLLPLSLAMDDGEFNHRGGGGGGGGGLAAAAAAAVAAVDDDWRQKRLARRGSGGRGRGHGHGGGGGDGGGYDRGAMAAVATAAVAALWWVGAVVVPGRWLWRGSPPHFHVPLRRRYYQFPFSNQAIDGTEGG